MCFTRSLAALSVVVALTGLAGSAPAGASSSNQTKANQTALAISNGAVAIASAYNAAFGAKYVAQAVAQAGIKGLSAAPSAKVAHVWRFLVPTGSTKTAACVLEPAKLYGTLMLYRGGVGPC